MTHVFLEGTCSVGNGWLREVWAELTGWRKCRCHPRIHRQRCSDTAGLLLSQQHGPAVPSCSRHLGASPIPFAVEAALRCVQLQTLSRREKMKVPLCGLGIPLSRGDTCFLPYQATTTVSVLLKQENTVFNGLTTKAHIWEVGVWSSSPCFKSDKEFEPLLPSVETNGKHSQV